jgi:hypothetical protein
MAEQGASSVPVEVVVVRESMRLVHFTWAIVVGITVVGVTALNLFVDITPENRVATTVLTIVAPVAFISWWVWNVRHPARIEFSHEAITYKVRASKKMMTIERTNGEVEVAVEATMVGTHAAATQVLRSPSGGPSLPIATFDFPEIRRACEVTGWTLVGKIAGARKKN